MSKLSLYERLGEDALERAVYLFYDKVFADDLLRPFFKGVDAKALAGHQYHFLMKITDGPDQYEGKGLRDAHRRLVLEQGLGDKHFDAIKNHLKKTLEELGIGYATIEELMGAVESFRNEVLNR